MTDSITSQFSGFKSKLSASEASIRQGALDYFKEKGLPSRKNEDWKYTSLQYLENVNYVAPRTEITAEERNLIQNSLSSEFFHLIFFNGDFQADMSDAVPGLTIKPRDLMLNGFEDSLMALNWAMSLKPMLISVSPHTFIEKPVQLIFFSSAASPQMTYVNVDISVGEGSKVSLLESHAGQGAYVANAFVKVTAAPNSKVTYIHCQEQSLIATHIARTHFEIKKEAQVESLSISLGAHLSRHSQKFSLQETGAFVRSLGVYVTSQKQHSDHTGLIDHEVGGCTSYQIYKGLLKDQSRAVFSGKVLIRKDAQKAFSEQSNKNLLLTSGAEIDSKPQLEIYADDVQARHGSTVGQLNKEELFYLNSRGISADKAIPLLSFGFLSEILYQLEDQNIVSWLKTKLQKKLVDLQMEKT